MVEKNTVESERLLDLFFIYSICGHNFEGNILVCICCMFGSFILKTCYWIQVILSAITVCSDYVLLIFFGLLMMFFICASSVFVFDALF